MANEQPFHCGGDDLYNLFESLKYLPPNSASQTVIFRGVLKTTVTEMAKKSGNIVMNKIKTNRIIMKCAPMPTNFNNDNSSLIEAEVYKGVNNTFLDNNITPHVIRARSVATCGGFETFLKTFVRLAPPAERAAAKSALIRYQTLTKLDNYHSSSVIILFLEESESLTLHQYLANYIKQKSLAPAEELLSLAFQLFYTLHCFATHRLRHNDLHFNNIFVDKTSAEFYEYVLDERTAYRVPTYGLSLKIYDFDHAFHTFENTSLTHSFCHGYGVCNQDNPVFDVYTAIFVLLIDHGNALPWTVMFTFVHMLQHFIGNDLIQEMFTKHTFPKYKNYQHLLCNWNDAKEQCVFQQGTPEKTWGFPTGREVIDNFLLFNNPTRSEMVALYPDFLDADLDAITRIRFCVDIKSVSHSANNTFYASAALTKRFQPRKKLIQPPIFDFLERHNPVCDDQNEKEYDEFMYKSLHKRLSKVLKALYGAINAENKKPRLYLELRTFVYMYDQAAQAIYRERNKQPFNLTLVLLAVALKVLMAQYIVATPSNPAQNEKVVTPDYNKRLRQHYLTIVNNILGELQINREQFQKVWSNLSKDKLGTTSTYDYLFNCSNLVDEKTYKTMYKSADILILIRKVLELFIQKAQYMRFTPKQRAQYILALVSRQLPDKTKNRDNVLIQIHRLVKHDYKKKNLIAFNENSFVPMWRFNYIKPLKWPVAERRFLRRAIV